MTLLGPVTSICTGKDSLTITFWSIPFFSSSLTFSKTGSGCSALPSICMLIESSLIAALLTSVKAQLAIARNNKYVTTNTFNLLDTLNWLVRKYTRILPSQVHGKSLVVSRKSYSSWYFDPRQSTSHHLVAP